MSDPPAIEMLRRIPPHSRDLEEAILSACLQDPEFALPISAQYLSPASFYYEAHQALYGAMVKLRGQQKPVDYLSLIAYLREVERLDGCGGESYVYQCMCAVPNASAVESHCIVVAEKARLRDFIAALERAQTLAYSPFEHEDAIPYIEGALTALGSARGRAESVSAYDATVKWVEGFDVESVELDDGTVVNTLVPPPSLTTGFTDFDKYFDAFYEKEYVLVSGVPGGGKSSFVWSLLQGWAARGYPCLMFSAEMGDVALARRLLASETGIDGTRLKRGYFSDDETQRIQRAMAEVAGWPLYIIDHGAMSPRNIESIVREHVRKYGVRAVAVDYLQILSLEGPSKREALEEASRTMKRIAHENNIVLVSISQLNKTGKRQDDPEMSELHGASLENDPDWVIILKAAGEADALTGAQPMDVLVKKNRDGRDGRTRLVFMKAEGRWVDAEPEPPPAPKPAPSPAHKRSTTSKPKLVPQEEINLDRY